MDPDYSEKHTHNKCIFYVDIGAGYIEPADLLDRRIDSLNAWINQYYKNEAAAKKAAMKNIHAKPKEKPLEGEASSKKGGWASMFSF